MNGTILTEHQLDILGKVFQVGKMHVNEIFLGPTSRSCRSDKSLAELGLIEQQGEYLLLTKAGREVAEYWEPRRNLVR